jgi:hypothetical protein
MTTSDSRRLSRSGAARSRERLRSGEMRPLRPNANSAKRSRKTHVTALSDEDLIKQLKAAIDSQEICKKALDVIHQRIASRELSDNMLLRIVASLSKSAAWF